jgi:hypothetical protein
MSTPINGHARDNRTDSTGTIEGQARVYLRAYYRILKARPTTLQLAAMKAASIAAARYDRALRDDSLSGCTLAHYERTSRKTLAAMYATFPKREPVAPAIPSWFMGAATIGGKP